VVGGAVGGDEEGEDVATHGMVWYFGVGMGEWWCFSGVMVEYGILNEEESKARGE